MRKKQKMYKVELLNGFVNLQTISPNNCFYYQISKPFEISMGVFASKLAFFNQENDRLIYCTVNKNASFLPPFTTFKNVNWLEDGDYAFFVEYERNNSNLCLLSLCNNICYKKMIMTGESLESIYNYLTNIKLDEAIIRELGFKKAKSLNKNSYKNDLFNKWYPKC